MKIIFVIILFAFLFFGISVYATGTPSIFSYQGRLADSSGDLLTGTYYFKFSIWDNPTSNPSTGNKLWPSSDPTEVSATVTSGVFNVNIGDTDNGYPDALTYNFNTNKDIYLEVRVASSSGGSFETLSPRQRIASAVFSQLAGAVSGTGQSSFGTTTPLSDAVVSVQSTTTSAIPLVIRGITSQIADLFRIISSTGSKLFTFTAAGDAEINDGNLWACADGTCAASDPGTNGNVIVDTAVIFSNGFYLKRKDNSTTTLYDSTDTAIIDFDTEQ